MKTIEVSDEPYEKIKDQLTQEEKVDLKVFEDMIGKKFFFRTVTYHMVGKVVKFLGSFVVLEDAAWVADSGRFSNCILKGEVSEVEPVETAMINLNSVTDFFPWKFNLLRKQK